MPTKIQTDVVVIGAGAAGLMAAATAGMRGRRVILIEHTAKIGEKIRISGGGRSNFTNLHASPKNYICQNKHFAKSALARYTQHDFIKLIESYNISYHEKTLGQLFCDLSSKQIINMLLSECQKAQVDVRTLCTVEKIEKNTHEFIIITNNEIISAKSVIIATGGLSIPLIGASDFGYKIARQFGIKVLATQPALVPLKVSQSLVNMFAKLSGVSQNSVVSHKGVEFRENILFTHRGLSGPAILQISSYLEKFSNTEITIDLLPDIDLKNEFVKHKNSKQTVANFLKNYFPNRLAEALTNTADFDKSITDTKNITLFNIAENIHKFKVIIDGSEGYQKAEVTKGGVDTDELSSKTMESITMPGLYFIGEVVDVTGWLGGYNFQWAWSSGYAAGSYC